MQTSSFLQAIESNNGWALCYHALFGNMFLLEPQYYEQLKKLRIDRTDSKICLADSLLKELCEARFLEEDESEARIILAQKNQEWLRLLPGGGRLKLLNLIVSETCNLNCGHCLHRCSVETCMTHGSKKLMDWSTAKFAIDRYAEVIERYNPAVPLSVHFGSAEPLLNWDVMRRVCEYVRRLDPSANLAVNTNLTLLNHEIAKFFVDFDVKVSISLDGPIKGNDAIRVYSDGQGT